MRTCKTRGFSLFVLAGLALACIHVHAGDARAETSITEFGESLGRPLESGFVFHDGRYVDMPYKVSRKGLAVYINDVLARPPIEWPPRNVAVDHDPGLPAGLDADSSFKDIENTADPYEAVWHRKYRFVMQHLPQEEATREMAKWFQNLPFVANVSQGPAPSFLTVRAKNGEEKIYSLLRPPEPGFGVVRSPSRQDVLSEAEGRRREIERKLQAGTCIFLFVKGGELLLDHRKAAQVLPEMVVALRSSTPKEEKLSELQKLSILPPQYPEAWNSIVTNFQMSAQLENRMQDLRRQRMPEGADHRSLEEEQAIRNKPKAK